TAPRLTHAAAGLDIFAVVALHFAAADEDRFDVDGVVWRVDYKKTNCCCRGSWQRCSSTSRLASSRLKCLVGPHPGWKRSRLSRAPGALAPAASRPRAPLGTHTPVWHNERRYAWPCTSKRNDSGAERLVTALRSFIGG